MLESPHEIRPRALAEFVSASRTETPDTDSMDARLIIEKMWLTELLTSRSGSREGRENWLGEGQKSGFLASRRVGKRKQRIGVAGAVVL